MSAVPVQFDFLAEPRGQQYAALLRVCAQLAVHFTLIERSGLEFGREATQVLGDLASYLVSEAEVKEWPGTRLLTEKALLRRFTVNGESMSILRRSVDGLFEWRQPNRPEDLVFWRNGESAVLVSIAHEKDAYLMLSPSEFDQHIGRNDELRQLLRPASGER